MEGALRSGYRCAAEIARRPPAWSGRLRTAAGSSPLSAVRVYQPGAFVLCIEDSPA